MIKSKLEKLSNKFVHFVKYIVTYFFLFFPQPASRYHFKFYKKQLTAFFEFEISYVESNCIYVFGQYI